MTTSAAVIRRRMSDSAYLNGWRRKVHDLRLITAGDYSRVDPDSIPQIDGFVPPDLKRKSLSELYDVMVRDYEEGTSNKMLQAIKTLVMQVSYKFPTVEFNGISPVEAEVNSAYLAARMGPSPRGCNTVHHMRLALLDYIIGGMGWVWCGLQDGKPCVQNVDSLDVAWDLGARLVTDIRWVAVRWIDTLGYWVQQYGKKPFKALIQQPKDKDKVWQEQRVELWFYFDLEGDAGTHAVFIGDSGIPGQADPLILEPNPHIMLVDGSPQPFLPLEPMYFMQLPSVRNPIGIAEMMLPAQMDTRLAERYMRVVCDRGAPWIDIDASAYEGSELDKLEKGAIGQMIKRNPGKAPAQVMGGMEIPQSVMEWYQHNDQELTAHSGANPYATGNRVEGVKYASEVVAIQGTAGLTAGTLAADHGAHYERVIAKFMYNALVYDFEPLTLSLDDVTLHFGADNPIGQYLRPDAVPIISEETLQFQTQEKRMQLAAQNLQVAIQVTDSTRSPMMPMGVAPATIALQYQAYLRAAGERDIDKHFAPPEGLAQPPMLPQPQPGQPGQVPVADNKQMQTQPGTDIPGNELAEQSPQPGKNAGAGGSQVISFPSVQPSMAAPH